MFCCVKKIKWVRLLLEHTLHTCIHVCLPFYSHQLCFVRFVFKKNVCMIIIHVLKYHTVVLFLHDSDLFYLTDSCSNKYMCKTTHATVGKSFYYISHIYPPSSFYKMRLMFFGKPEDEFLYKRCYPKQQIFTFKFL